jgi:hypothetical protein
VIWEKQWAAYLRKIEVAPNGHKNAKKRRLRDKGVQFILETCRAMSNFAVKRRHPPYVGNPFLELPLDRLKIEDAKPIFVFDAATELAFLKAASDWAFPLHFTLAKTGLRVGELTHLLIEELDLEGGWLHVRNKTGLGWRVKTGNERSVPLLAVELGERADQGGGVLAPHDEPGPGVHLGRDGGDPQLLQVDLGVLRRDAPAAARRHSGREDDQEGQEASLWAHRMASWGRRGSLPSM